MATESQEDERVSEGYLVVLTGRAWGISLGMLLGIGLFIATNVLVLKGGEHVGSHLKLLSHYLPGYDVTFLGSLVGFVYAFVFGWIIGRLICFVYNAVAARQRPPAERS